MRALLVTGLVAAVMLSGCSNFANRGSVFRTTDVNNGATLILDSEQNALVNVNRGDSQVICSQPSPDTAAADSVSAALGLTLNEGDAAEAGFAAGQAVASIGLRTQSIQLLRDSYFRLCEAYQNGGIDPVEYGISMRRIQNTMIAVLAVEQLTGTTVAGTGAAASQGSGSAGDPSGSGGGSASASTTSTASASDASTQSTDAATESIADAVQTITLAAITQDYTLPLCVDMLRWNYHPQGGPMSPGAPLYGYCVSLIENDLGRQQQRAQTAELLIQYMLDNPDMSAEQRSAFLSILSNIAADGDFRGLTQLIVPQN